RHGDRRRRGDGERRHHPPQGRFAGHRAGATSVARDDEQHPPEPLLRLRLQRARRADRGGRPLPMVRAAAQSDDRQRCHEPELRHRDRQRAPAALRRALSAQGRTVMNRRRFLLSSAATLGTAAVARFAAPGFAAEAAPTILRAGTRTIDVQGKAAKVFGIRQPEGTAGIFTTAGARFRVRLENEAGEPTLIHWHGLSPPYQQDGVPGVSGPPIAPGDSEDYDFPLTFPGTFWMHSHQGMQEQRLMTAPLIVRDAGDAGLQEVVVMLQDFSFRSPEEIFAVLQKKPAPVGTAMGGTATAGMAMSGGAKS